MGFLACTVDDKCLRPDQWCDQVIHCADNSDENRCSKKNMFIVSSVHRSGFYFYHQRKILIFLCLKPSRNENMIFNGLLNIHNCDINIRLSISGPVISGHFIVTVSRNVDFSF